MEDDGVGVGSVSLPALARVVAATLKDQTLEDVFTIKAKLYLIYPSKNEGINVNTVATTKITLCTVHVSLLYYTFFKLI